ERPAFANFPAGILIQGAVPIMARNECVGAIGVSGVQSHQDEQVAQAGVAAIGGLALLSSRPSAQRESRDPSGPHCAEKWIPALASLGRDHSCAIWETYAPVSFIISMAARPMKP